MENISIILVAHNQKDLIINQINLLNTLNNISSDSIIIVDNYSSDGLDSFLKAQNKFNYIICDEHIENFSSILNLCISEFVLDTDILVIQPECILMPSTIDTLRNALDINKKIYAVTPLTLCNGYNNINSLSDAIAYSFSHTHDNNSLSKIMKPLDNTVLISKKLLNTSEPFDNNLISSEAVYSDFFIQNILNDNFTYTVNNAYQYLITPYSNYYYDNYGNDSDHENIKNKWHTNYLNTNPNYNLINCIETDYQKTLNILEIGCDTGSTMLEIKNIYPNSNLFGIEINPSTAKIASHIANIKIADIEDNIDLWDGILFDYIIFGDVLEHLHNPSKIINNCRKILKKHGKIISSIPNLMHYSAMYLLINGDFPYSDTGILDRTHIHFFTYNEIIKLYNENNFKVIKCTPVFSTTKLNDELDSFIDNLVCISTHKNRQLYEAFQYVTLAEKID